MSCEEIAKLTSQGLDGKLTLGQRMIVKLHYYMCYCPICKKWLDQLTITQEAFRKLEDKLEAGEVQTDVHLSEEARERILDRCNKA